MVVSGATPRVDLAPCAREESCLNSDSLTVLRLLPPREGYSSTSRVFVRVYLHVHSVAVRKQLYRLGGFLVERC